MPFELRPYPNPTLRPEGDYLRRAWAESVYPLARRMGIPITLPDVSPQPHTHLAFEGYQYARERRKGYDYTVRVLEVFFREGRDIGDPEVLAGLAADVGLDRKDFEDALASRRYREIHRRALQHAYQEAGVSGVPLFFIGRRVLHGLQDEETLSRVIDEELLAQRS
jgi:predicted DsbA family dithiol-disulfide isomerase